MMLAEVEKLLNELKKTHQILRSFHPEFPEGISFISLLETPPMTAACTACQEAHELSEFQTRATSDKCRNSLWLYTARRIRELYNLIKQNNAGTPDTGIGLAAEEAASRDNNVRRLKR